MASTHINDGAAQYYDYALSYLLLFQFHDHIANQILHQNPHSTDYYADKDVGEFRAGVMRPGASVDWRQMLQETIGGEMSAQAMLSYFEPLMAFLKKANQGRKGTLPEIVL
jgi:peptidyl-dipeptidase A